VRSDKGIDPRKDGSLSSVSSETFARQATGFVNDTLGHRAKGSQAFGNGEPASKCVRGGCVKAYLSRDLGDPWRGPSPGEERLRQEGNTDCGMNGLAGGITP
jgi:hypothetical protein